MAGLGVTARQATHRYIRVARQWRQGHQVLTHPDDRTAVTAAAGNVRYIATAWPRLHPHVDLDDPAPVLAGQLWNLTLLAGECAAARQIHRQLHIAGSGVPDGTTTAAELRERVVRIDADLARLTAEIDQRSTQLRRLAKEVEAFVTEQQALARANALIRDVDKRQDLSVSAPADAVGDLADHTTAVLAAYRELTQLPGPASR